VAAKPKPKPKKVAAKPKRKRTPKKVAKAPPSKPAPKKDVGAAVTAAEKALRDGQFADARASIESILKDAPKHKKASRLRRKLNETQRALALGRLAYDGADCARTIETLERVLAVSPGAKNASHMVDRCRDALPPTTL